MKRLLTCVAVAVVSIALSFGQRSLDAVTWLTYKSGTTCNINNASTKVIRSSNDFETFWRSLTGSSQAPTDVNFNTDMLVCITLGQRNSGGYSISVQKVQKSDSGNIVVNYVEKRPNPRMRVTMAITTPYVIIKMKQRPETISFSGETVETQGFVDPFEPSDNYGTGDRVQWGLYLTGAYCNIEEPRNDVISSVSEFRRFWLALNGQDNIPRDIDFSESQLICICLGKRPTSGYSVYVQSVVRPNKNNVVVTYTEKRPGPRDRIVEQLCSPFVILKIPRSEAKVTFKPQSEDSKGNDHYRNRDRSPIGMGEDAIFYRNYTFGAVSKITAAQTRVITSTSEFAAYWKELTGSTDRPRDINFDNEQLVAIHLGSKPSSGYSVAVTSVTKPVSNQIVITYIERRPGPQDKVNGEPCSPYVVIRMPRTSGKIVFKPSSVDGR